MRTLLLIVGSLLPFIATGFYIVSIVKGQTRPKRMTRLLLLVITAVMFTSLWAGHDTSGIWLALVSFLQALFICILSLKRGIGGRERLDVLCLILCVGGILLWIWSGSPWLGLIASIIADCIAIVPSLVKTIRLPHTELLLFYAIDVVAGMFILLAGPFTLEAIVFPAYIALINLAFVVAIRWPRRIQLELQERLEEDVG